MKATEENIKILKRLGFTCDYDRTKNQMDEEWYSLDNGWGFRLDAVKSFKHLIKRIFVSKDDDNYE